MRLKVKHLSEVVKQTIKEEKITNVLRTEAVRVLGPSVDTNKKLSALAEAINARIDLMEMTGRKVGTFKTSILASLINHPDQEIRKLCVRMLPESFVPRFANDKSRSVRLAAGRRAPLQVVREMMKKFPSDEELRLIYSKKKSNENSLTLLESLDDEFDVNGKKLGDSGKTYDDGLELSDFWYENAALELFRDYQHQGPIELNWEERAVSNFVRHSKATNGVVIDKIKLYNTLKELIEKNEKDELHRQIGTGTLDESFEFNISDVLNECAAALNENHVVEFKSDPVSSLVESFSSASMYVEKFNVLFKVKNSTVPAAIKKYLIGESHSTVNVPSKCTLPVKGKMRVVDEQALDMFCESWNKLQKSKGEPFKIDWSVDPCDVNNACFTVELK